MSEEAETPSENFAEAKRKAKENGRASKTPMQKRAETEKKRQEWDERAIAEAFAAAGGTPKTTSEETRGPGRPPLIDDIDLERVEMYAAGGLTKHEIAESIGIGLSTLMTYQKEYPEFLEAINRGRARNVQEVENALHKSAKGYTYIEDKIFYDSQVGKVVVQPTVKRVNPDTKAALAILHHAETGSWRPKADPLLPPPGEAVKKVISFGGVKIEV